ncbi:DUF3179 domain-containing protein [bacterium]|nr:DUF3179 domain-containing protein [bacterium]
MRILALFSLSLFLLACQENNIASKDDDLIWTINTEYMRQGCYNGRDCIPSLEQPNRSDINGSDLSFLQDDDRVVGVWNGSDYVAYPHAILDWHEIINEDGYSISYCPLTGSAINLSTNHEFGVSGLLYNSNLIMYDRASESYWPQMLLKSAAGDSSGSVLHMNNLVETTWGNWKSLFPDTKVINSNTGYSRNYTTYPYGSYRSCNSPDCNDYIYFPISNDDDRLNAKTRVLTLINNDVVMALDIGSYSDPQILSVNVGGKDHQVVISGNDDLAVAFETGLSLDIESWDISNGEIILKELGADNRWDITGKNISDNTGGTQLKAANGYIAYWFSVAAFYPNVELVNS